MSKLWVLATAGLAAAVLMLAAPSKSQAQSFSFSISSGYRPGCHSGPGYGGYGGYSSGSYFNGGYGGYPSGSYSHGGYGSGWNGGYSSGFHGGYRPPVVIVQPNYGTWRPGPGYPTCKPFPPPCDHHRFRPY